MGSRGILRATMLSALLLSGVLPLEAQRPLRGGGKLPPVLLRAIGQSAKQRFSGRRTVTVNREGEISRHEEIILRDGPRLHIEFPDNSFYAGQVIVENLKERQHYNPDTNEVRILASRRGEGLLRLRKWVGRFATAPGPKIAGYATTEVSVLDPRGKVVQRLAIEPDSGIVLSRRVFNAVGQEIGGHVFTKVDLNPGSFDPALFRIDRKGVKRTTPWQEVIRLARQSKLSAVGLPPSSGFRLDEVRLGKVPEGQVLIQTYRNPATGRVTLFQLRAAVDAARLQRQQKNGVRSVSWKSKGYTFVLLGPQDDATLKRLKAAVGPQS